MGVEIVPMGVKPERFLSGFAWRDTIWRRGRCCRRHARCLLHSCPHRRVCNNVVEYCGCRVGAKVVCVGVNDMDVFRG